MQKASLTTLAILTSISLHSAAAPAEGALGMVLDVRGNVQSQDHGTNGKLQLLSYLKPKMQLNVAEGGKLSVSLYATHSLYQIEGPALIEVNADSLKVLQGKPPVVKPMGEKLVGMAANTNFVLGAYQMRALVPKIVIGSPENGSVLLDNQVPSFNWTAAEAATYDFSLMDDNDKSLASAKLQDTSYAPAAKLALESGKTYHWSVSYTSAKDHKSYSATGEFNIASKEEVATINESRPAVDAPIEEWVLYAALLENMKSFSEARKVWQMIAQTRPDLKRVGN